jgi:hypothetical protein
MKPSHQTLMLAAAFLLGVWLSPKVKTLPVLNKIPG